MTINPGHVSYPRWSARAPTRQRLIFCEMTSGSLFQRCAALRTVYQTGLTDSCLTACARQMAALRQYRGGHARRLDLARRVRAHGHSSRLSLGPQRRRDPAGADAANADADAVQCTVKLPASQGIVVQMSRVTKRVPINNTHSLS